jgi:hypothetical protein
LVLALHPELTVVSGAGPEDRAGLIDELLGALGEQRAGVHLEFLDDQGRELVVYRPTDGPHRVLEVATGSDVTESFRLAGTIDLLSTAWPPTEDRRRWLCVAAADLAADTDEAAAIGHLAGIDPEQLWDLADAVTDVVDELSGWRTAEAAREDPALVALVEAAHAEAREARELVERTRAVAVPLAGVLAVLSVAAGVVGAGGLAALGILGGAASLGLLAWQWRRAGQAEAAEHAALASGEASSYLAFQLDRADGLFPDPTEREARLELAELHERALDAWTELVGPVDLGWAVAHRAEIEATRHIAGTPPVDATPRVHRLAVRLGQLAQRPGTRPPVVLDDPAPGADDAELDAVLRLVGAATEHLQIVLLTDDPRTADWAARSAGDELLHLELGAGEHAPLPEPSSVEHQPV